MRVNGPVDLSIHTGQITQGHAVGLWPQRLQKSNLLSFSSTVGLKVIQIIEIDLCSPWTGRTATKQAGSDNAQSKCGYEFASANEHSLSPIQKLHEAVEPGIQGS